MTAGQHTTDIADVSAADLTEAMMATYGHRVPLEIISALVHDVLDAHAHPSGAPIPRALGRQVDRRLRELVYTAEPGLRPPLSARGQAIARALNGRRS